MKSGFFKNINKNDKSLENLIKRRRGKSQINKIRDKKYQWYAKDYEGMMKHSNNLGIQKNVYIFRFL